MSKSKGEFLTVSLLEEKGYDPMVYRFFCLQSHYRKGLVFSWENLDNARTAYDKLIARTAALKDEGELDQPAMEMLRASFRSAMDNDLNTSMGVTVLYDVLKAKLSGRAKRALLAEFDQVLSLGLLDRAAKAAAPQAEERTESDPEIDALVSARTQAKKDKNWAEADRIRDELKARGVELIDTKEGTRWKRI